MAILIIVLSVILIIMSLLLLVVSPVAGVIGFCIGVLVLLKGIKMRKTAPSKTDSVSSAPSSAPAASSFAISSDSELSHSTASFSDSASRHTFSCPVVGLKYRLKNVQSLLDECDDYSDPDPELERIYKYNTYYGPCVLEPEPTNKHDPNAVKVLVEDIHIGYIPSEKCNTVKKFFDKNPTAHIEIYGGPYKEYDSMDERWNNGSTSLAAKIKIAHD